MQSKICIGITELNSHNLWNYLDLTLVQTGALLRNSNLHSHFFAKGGIEFQGFQEGLSLTRSQIKVSKSFSLLMLLHAMVVWVIFYKLYLTYFKVLRYHMCCTTLDRWILIFVLICTSTSSSICKTLNDIKVVPIKMIFMPLMRLDNMFHKLHFWNFHCHFDVICWYHVAKIKINVIDILLKYIQRFYSSRS